MKQLDDRKSKSEIIVELLCDGKKIPEIMDIMTEPRHRVEKIFKQIRFEAFLPWDKNIYIEKKVDILKNIEKCKQNRINLIKIKQEHEDSLVKFDL